VDVVDGDPKRLERWDVGLRATDELDRIRVGTMRPLHALLLSSPFDGSNESLPADANLAGVERRGAQRVG
jgi:hypothetical protein